MGCATSSGSWRVGAARSSCVLDIGLDGGQRTTWPAFHSFQYVLWV